MGNSVTYRMEMSAENMRNIFGEGDQYIKKIEKELQVAIVNRDGFLSVIGGEKEVKRAVGLLSELSELSCHGRDIGEQKVDYGI